MVEPPLTQRQAQIVDAAMRLIATRGPRRFTVEVLASEIGVTGGAIYRHFQSMEAIVDAVVDRMGQMLFDGFPPKDADPVDRLRHFFLQRTRVVLENPHVSRLLLSDNLSQAAGAVHAERLQEFKRRTQRFVLDCLREAAEVGRLSREITPEAGAVLVVGAVLSLAHQATRVAADPQGELLCEQVWSALDCVFRPAPRGGEPTPRTDRRPSDTRSRKNTGEKR